MTAMPVPSAASGVDKLMSRDIQSFMTSTAANRTDRSRKPLHVMPSPGLAPASHMPVYSSVGYYPRNSLILAADHKRAGFGPSGARYSEDNTHELYLQDSHELDLRSYSGGAELRGQISLTSPKPAADVSREVNLLRRVGLLVFLLKGTSIETAV